MKKSRATIVAEGTLYVIIAAGSPFAEFLISDRVISSRALAAVCVIALVAGANALKAFLSQSMSDGKDEPPAEVVVSNTVKTEEQPPAVKPPWGYSPTTTIEPPNP